MSIIVTKQGVKQELPYAQALDSGVFTITFQGDETYTDPFDGSIWNWEDVDNDLEEVINVVNGSEKLIAAISIDECKNLLRSYFWDDTNGVLYIHWNLSSSDYSIGRDLSFYSSVIEGFSTGYHKATNNTFDGVFYPTNITNIGGLSRNVDPIKFGTITHDESSLTITNQNGNLDDLNPIQIIGQPVFFYKVDETDTELTDDMKIFSGFYSDYSNNKSNSVFKVVENRLFENAPMCPNVADIETYPSIGKNEGKEIPVAWGDIRRGIMLLTNEDDLKPRDDIKKTGDVNLSTVITIDDTSGLEVGMFIEGVGIQEDTKIVGIAIDTGVSMDKAGTATNNDIELTFIFDEIKNFKNVITNGDIANGSNIISNIGNFSDIVVGMTVSCTGVPEGTTIVALGGLWSAEASMSTLATVDLDNVQITFIHAPQLTTFLVADRFLGSILEIDNVRDKEDELVDIESVDLEACTVTVNKVASVSISDLKKWTWEGKGYDILGDYNNGLDIIKDAFQKLASIPFIESTFNKTEWITGTSNNLESIGISVQSTKGFTEMLIQPITVSLQGLLEIQGDSRITWVDRDITASPIYTIKDVEQEIDPVINIDPSQMVSELVIEYSKNFVDKEDLKTYVNSDNKNEVITNYSIDRRDPLSPIKTLLTTKEDATTISQEIMATSASPNRIINVDLVNIVDGLRVLNVLGVDTGRFGDEQLEYGEILNITPNYITFREKITMRVIPNYTP